MNSEELKTLAVRLTTLTDALEQRSALAVDELSQHSSQLQRVTKGLGLEGQRVAQETVSIIGSQANDAIKRGLQQAIEQCGMQLQQVAQQAAQVTANLRAEAIALQAAQRGVIWKSALALLLGSLLALGTLAYLIWKNLEVTRDAQFSSAVVQATRSGVLTQCVGVLCVKAIRNAPRYEKNADYILLKP